MTYRREEEEARSRALEVTASLANTKMSARERNRAKRKAKEAAKLAKQQDRYQRALARRTGCIAHSFTSLVPMLTCASVRRSTRRLSTSSNAIKPASNEASAASMSTSQVGLRADAADLGANARMARTG